MKIHLLTQVGRNFGDELNRWLWPELLGDVTGDTRDDVLFVGIGTILDRHLPPARVTIVFGTGVGYAAAPRDLLPHSARWRIYGVRGPMTARALNIDPPSTFRRSRRSPPNGRTTWMLRLYMRNPS